MTDWKGQRVRIAVFKEHWHAGRCDQRLVIRFLTYLDTDTTTDLFDRYSPADGHVFSITPRREGD